MKPIDREDIRFRLCRCFALAMLLCPWAPATGPASAQQASPASEVAALRAQVEALQWHALLLDDRCRSKLDSWVKACGPHPAMEHPAAPPVPCNAGAINLIESLCHMGQQGMNYYLCLAHYIDAKTICQDVAASIRQGPPSLGAR